jgi:hypothetical protein
VASVGASLGVIPPAVFSVVVMMSVATTLIVPPVLALLYRGDGVHHPTIAPQPKCLYI